MKKGSLEHRIFRASLVYIMLMLGYVLLYRLYQKEFITVGIYTIGEIATFSVFSMSNREKMLQKIVLPWIFYMVFFAIFLWFKTGGHQGGSLVFFTVMLVSIMIAPRRWRQPLVIVFVFVQLGLILADTYLRHLPIWGENPKAAWDFLLLTLLNVALVWMLKSNYDVKEDKISKFSMGLRELHRLNLKQDSDLDETLNEYLRSGAELLGMRTGLIIEVEEDGHVIRNINSLHDGSPSMKEAFVLNQRALEEIKNSDKTYFQIISPKTKPTEIIFDSMPTFFIGTPLHMNEKVFGVLSFSTEKSTRKVFEDYEIEIIELMALNISHLLDLKFWREGQIAADKALKLSEKRFKSIYEYANVGISLCDKHGKFVMANQAVSDMSGYTEKEILETSFYAFSQLEEMDELDEDHRRYKQIISGEIDHYSIEKKKHHKDGHLIHISKTVSAIRDENGDVQFAVIISDDITGRRLNEEKIISLNEALAVQIGKLEVANKELESFSYSVSHDLRAPLRAIDGFSKIILEDHKAEFSDESKRLLNVIIKNSGKMAMLIDDLLTFSRISRRIEEFKIVDFQEVVEDIIEEQALDRSVLKVGALPKIRGEKTLMKQVLSNLIGNAFKFSSKKEKPLIEVGSVQKSEGCEFFVKDNGVGFNMAYFGKIFGVFQRLHTDEEFNGTGVGLAIVHKVIQKHGGEIWAESIEGQGATFYFTLPK